MHGTSFASFFMGGFEASCFRRNDGRQLDLIQATRHDLLATTDYRLLQDVGIRTVRDALRWHRVERSPGRYDWSSFLPMLHAAQRTGTQVIWELCHFGIPPDLDIYSPAFIYRFAAFARAAAQLIRNETEGPPVYTPVNEISFWSWAGGDRAAFYPGTSGRGAELKRQLVRASVAAIAAVRDVEPRARFLQPEPLIHIAPRPDHPDDASSTEAHRLGQYEAWDMLSGQAEPALGGGDDCLDVVGANFYYNNQWITFGETLGFGHPLFRPLSEILMELHGRYRRPIVISETGAEGGNGPGWLRYVMGEVRAAMRAGLPVVGLCLYPVLDYPGWSDGRHCRCGLLSASDSWRSRGLVGEMVRQLREEAMLLELQEPTELTITARLQARAV